MVVVVVDVTVVVAVAVDDEWKASYHNSRALSFTKAWIDEILK